MGGSQTKMALKTMAALSRVAINFILSCLLKKPNKTQKG